MAHEISQPCNQYSWQNSSILLIILYKRLPKIVYNFVYNIACHIVYIAQFQFVVHIARIYTKMLEIVHKIVLVPFADVKFAPCTSMHCAPSYSPLAIQERKRIGQTILQSFDGFANLLTDILHRLHPTTSGPRATIAATGSGLILIFLNSILLHLSLKPWCPIEMRPRIAS